MSTPAFGPNLMWVFFTYGLAFFGMGLAMALESGRYPAIAAGRLLWPLALFGILHGTHEWLEFFLLQAATLGAAMPIQLPWIRLSLLAASFTALFLFGAQTYARSLLLPRNRWYTITALVCYGFGLAASVWAAFPVDRNRPVELVDALIRYSLAFPGSLFAAVGLVQHAAGFPRARNPGVGPSLTWAAAGFGLYGLTQLVVPRLALFPANWLNQESFRVWTGIPHQILRTMLAVVITWSLLSALHWMEKLRRAEMVQAEAARVRATAREQDLRRELLLHTVRAQEEERGRIARELHDETSQILSAFGLELAALGGLSPRRKDVSSKIEHLQELSRSMSRGLYRMVHALRPAQLDDLGLVPALESLVEHDWRPNGLEIAVHVDGACRRLDSLIETVLFRVAQEAVSNVARHSGTRAATLRLVYGVDEVALSVADAGTGFDVAESFTAPRGWGLAGMRERIESIGGHFELQSTPGGGTKVQAFIPLGGNPEAAWKRSG